MKKIFPIICGAMIILTGCSHTEKTAKPAKPDENFCKTAVITQNDKEYTAKLKRGGKNTWECTFSKPETINGMTITYSGGNARIEFMDLSYSIPQENLPEYGMITMLTGAIEKIISANDISCSEIDGNITEKGVVNGQDFTAQFNGSNLSAIEISKSIKAKFT